jgi:hypothetical protein
MDMSSPSCEDHSHTIISRGDRPQLVVWKALRKMLHRRRQRCGWSFQASLIGDIVALLGGEREVYFLVWLDDLLPRPEYLSHVPASSLRAATLDPDPVTLRPSTTVLLKDTRTDVRKRLAPERRAPHDPRTEPCSLTAASPPPPGDSVPDSMPPGLPALLAARQGLPADGMHPQPPEPSMVTPLQVCPHVLWLASKSSCSRW